MRVARWKYLLFVLMVVWCNTTLASQGNISLANDDNFINTQVLFASSFEENEVCAGKVLTFYKEDGWDGISQDKMHMWIDNFVTRAFIEVAYINRPNDELFDISFDGNEAKVCVSNTIRLALAAKMANSEISGALKSESTTIELLKEVFKGASYTALIVAANSSYLGPYAEVVGVVAGGGVVIVAIKKAIERQIPSADEYIKNNLYLWYSDIPTPALFTIFNNQPIKFVGSSSVYLSSNNSLWPIKNEEVYSLLGFRSSDCSITPDWDYVTEFSSFVKIAYANTLKTTVLPSANDYEAHNLIAYKVVEKVGPASCGSYGNIDSTKIYLFGVDNKFHHIKDEEIYYSLGYKDDWSEVVEITPELFDFYGEGEEVVSCSVINKPVFLSAYSTQEEVNLVPIDNNDTTTEETQETTTSEEDQTITCFPQKI